MVKHEMHVNNNYTEKRKRKNTKHTKTPVHKKKPELFSFETETRYFIELMK